MRPAKAVEKRVRFPQFGCDFPVFGALCNRCPSSTPSGLVYTVKALDDVYTGLGLIARSIGGRL